MVNFNRVVSVVKALARVFITYEFLRSIAVNVARQRGTTQGLTLVLDLFVLIAVGLLEEDETRSWPIVITGVLLTEAIRLAVVMRT